MPLENEAVRHRPTLVVGLVGAAAPLALAVVGQSEPGPAMLAAAAVAALGWVLSGRPPSPAAVASPVPPAAPPSDPMPYAAIVEELEDPVMVVEAGTPGEAAGRRLVFANAAARTLFRIQRQDARLITAIRNPQVIELVDEALIGGISGHGAFEAGGAHDRVWTAAAQPLAAGAGGPPLALLVLRDQTDLRRAERMRADFLANASHELRTPLASLTGFIETLRGPARDDAGAREKFLGIMQTQAERMARLIDDLMSLSRIELNEHIAPQGRVDLAMAVTDVADALTPVIRGRGVSIDWAPPERGAATVEGDRDQIIQVIQNLIDNAVKYSPRDGVVRVEVSAPAGGDPPAIRDPDAAGLTLLAPDHRPGERYALLRISDFGPGLARDALPRLTERFYRVEGQKSGDRSGTGLGLAIVKHIVNRHRGGISVESAEGRGATFSVWLPLATADRTTDPEAVVKPS
ncbi:MAG: ATP-binding protein [Caulobacter sp.]|nr:ATP-binding protein [Caulobacter sp.]